jgi:glutamate dehydrogenase/leucine dehydrogenase
MANLAELLEKFENKKPEIVFEWHDSETEAVGWVVINSLRGGAAGGGTRMRLGLDRREVESLAKTMEVKFTVSGPAIGGAKSGINFDPRDPRKKDVLKRWYRAVAPLLKNYYGTGGDMNVDEIEEVIPMTEEYGLWHPQEGIVNGHFRPNDAQKINKLGQLRQGVAKIIEDSQYTPSLHKKYRIADMITGYGVAQSVLHYYEIWGGKLNEKRAVIQGWGNVGGAAGFYLAQMGVKIVGIIDRDGGLMKPEGFSLEEITNLLLTRDGNKLVSPDLIPAEELMKKVWDMEAEIFIPAAGSRLVTKEQVERMVNKKLELIACGANVPFNDREIFFGATADYADNQVSMVPDFVANCGMARVFAYLMNSEVEITDRAVFKDTSTVIRAALEKTYAVNHSRTQIAKRSFEIALKQLV